MKTNRRQKRTSNRVCSVERLEFRHMLAADWMNPARPNDVNNDMLVTPIDALIVINELNRGGSRGDLGARPHSLASYLDTSGDGMLSPLDALRVINQLNSRENATDSRSEGESEPAPAGFISIIFARLPGDSTQIVELSSQINIVREEFNEIGLFIMDGPEGEVNGVLPTSPFYSQEVFAQAERRVLFSRQGLRRESNEVVMPAGSFVGVYVLQETSDNGNPEDHMRVEQTGTFRHRIGWEEHVTRSPWGGVGNRGYDDVLVDIQIGTPQSGNNEPVIVGIPSQSVDELVEFVFNVQATDADLPNDLLRYSLDRAPVGMEINNVTGRITWTPQESQGPGVFNVVVRVTDSTGLFDVESFTISVAEVNPATTFTLSEAGQFANQQNVDIDLGQAEGTRTISFRVEPTFDRTDQNSVFSDALAVYVVDPTAPQTTLLDRGEQGTAIFTLTEEGADYVPGLVRFDGRVVTIDVTQLGTRSNGRLRFQLLNGDNDQGTNIRVTDFANVTNPNALIRPSFTDIPLGANPSASQVNTTSYVAAGDIEILVSNIHYDSTSAIYEADLQLMNSGESVSRQVIVTLGNLPSGVTVTNATGLLNSATPYLNFQEAIPSGGLISGTTSAPVRVTLSNPNQVLFSPLGTVLAAGPNQAPILPVIAPITVVVGGVVSINLPKQDPNGDRVSYRLDAPGDLPPGRLNGILEFLPGPQDVGQYSFDLVATDGVLEARQTISLTVTADTLTSTRVSGQVLDVDGTPLDGMNVEIGSVRGLTDAQGLFTLDLGNGPLVSDTLKIRGETYPGPNSYPYIAEKLPLVLEREVFEGINNVIRRPIYLPKLDVANGVRINPMQDTLVTTATIPGASVMVRAGTLMNQQSTLFDGIMSITEVPANLTPAALPANLRPDLVLTIQPGEMVFTTPAPLTFPNTAGYDIGTVLDLWSINPVTGEFDDVGDMIVATDASAPGGSIIRTTSGGIRNSSWHFPTPPDPDPDPDDDGDEDDDCDECKATDGNFEVEAHSGAVLDDHGFVTYQSMGQTQGFALHYDSKRADPRPIVHLGYSNLLPRENQRLVASLSFMKDDFEFEMPGYEGTEYEGLNGGEHFWKLDVTGSGRVALQADFSTMESGLYTYELTSGPMQFNGQRFTGTLTTQTKELKVVNSIESPFGAGWGLHGLIEIVENNNGSLLWIDGGGSELYFAPASAPGQPLVSPPGNFSRLVKQGDGTYEQTMPDRMVYRFNSDHQIATKTDRNGNIWRYQYDSQKTISTITDPAGLETRFVKTNGRITSMIDPANRTTRFEYDASGNLTRITDPDNSSKSWDYDAGHRIISETDKRGFTERVFYDYAGRATKSLRADGSELMYNPVQTQVLRPIEQTVNPLNAPSVSEIEQIRSQFVDSNGNVTQRILDKQGQFVGGVDSAGSLGTVTRNSDNLIAKRNDSRGFTTDLTNDNRGNTTTIVEDVLVGNGGPVISLPYDQGSQDAVRTTTNFALSTLARNDDGSSGVVDVGFDLNFFGNNDRTVFVNNNGNITFDSSLSTYTPFSLLSSQRIIIAPFFADVDTRGVGEVTFGSGQLLGRNAFAVNWSNVGYYNLRTDKVNTFQLILVDRSDVEAGAFDFEMNYDTISWETGDDSGGNNGFGGSSARAGYSNGEDVFFELEGSDIDGGFLDRNLVTGLVNQSRTSSIPGRYRFEVRGGEVQRAMRQFEYDEQFSQLTRVIDELGRETLTTLDSTTGNTLSSRRVVGQLDTPANGETDDLVTRYTYTTFAIIDTVTDPLGRVTDYDYDSRGRLTSVTYAKGTTDEAIMRYEYDLAGNQTAMIDGNGNRTTYEYDLLNRMVKTIEADPDGAGPLLPPVTTFVYDAVGNVTSTTDANGNTSSSQFDDLNRLIESTGPDPDGAGPLPAPVTRYAYDPVGNLDSITDPNGNTTRYRYDGRNRRIESIDPDGGVTKFAYDSGNNLSQVTDPVGNITQFRYDARDRLVEEIDPLGKSILYGYDAANNLVQKTDRNGRVTKYSYDDVNRLIKEEWVGENDSIVNTINYRYDAAGNLLSVADVFGALTYTYDARNRVKTVDNAGTPDAPSVILTYGYDDNSNVITVADTISSVAGATTTYQYDAIDRLIVLGQSGNEVSNKRVNFTYNALGQYSAIDRYRDLAGTQLVIGTDYNYDQQNRLTRIDHKNAANTSVAFYDYEYDVASRITKITDVDGATNYEYDDRDQLISADHADAAFAHESYTYDANGNRTNSHLHGSGYVTGPGNRLLSDGKYNYEYDNEGNVIKRTEIATGNYRTFEWDYRNRLIAISNVAQTGLAVTEVIFEYDPINRRILEQTTGSVSRRIFIYDREDVLIDIDSVRNDITGIDRYLHGPGVDGVLAEQAKEGPLEWLLKDNIGSVRVIVSNASTVLQQVEYDAFGVAKVTSGDERLLTRYAYTGRELIESVDLYYNRRRFYEPANGRFLSEDPADADFNSYRYATNHPTGNVDPTGLFSVSAAVWHYFTGGGATVAAPFSDVDAALKPSDFPGFKNTVESLRGRESGMSISMRLSKDVGGYAGHVTFVLRGELSSDKCGWDFRGHVGALNDSFDFNSMPWGVRQYWAEIVTRAIGFLPGGTTFAIQFTGTRNVSDGGIWGDPSECRCEAP